MRLLFQLYQTTRLCQTQCLHQAALCRWLAVLHQSRRKRRRHHLQSVALVICGTLQTLGSVLHIVSHGLLLIRRHYLLKLVKLDCLGLSWYYHRSFRQNLGRLMTRELCLVYFFVPCYISSASSQSHFLFISSLPYHIIISCQLNVISHLHFFHCSPASWVCPTSAWWCSLDCLYGPRSSGLNRLCF